MTNVLQPFQSITEIRVANTKVGDADTLNFSSGASVSMVGNRADITVSGGGGGSGVQGPQGWQGLGTNGFQGVQGPIGGGGANHNILSSTHPDYFDTMASLQSMRSLWISYNSASSLYIMVGTRVISDAMQVPMYFGSSELVDITTVGVNGRDSGAEASGWYYIWAISTGVSAPKGLLSTSAFSPTLPPGYIYKRLIGSVYNETSTLNFVPFVQYGDTVYTALKLWFSSTSYTSGWASFSSAYISPIAREVYFNGSAYNGGGSDNAYMYTWPFALPSPSDNGVQVFHIEGYVNYDPVSACQWVPVDNQTAFFKVNLPVTIIEGYVNGYKYSSL